MVRVREPNAEERFKNEELLFKKYPARWPRRRERVQLNEKNNYVILERSLNYMWTDIYMNLLEIQEMFILNPLFTSHFIDYKGLNNPRLGIRHKNSIGL